MSASIGPVRKSFAELALNIQRPQLYGIIAGIIVFSLTILTVIILLFKSGTMKGFFEQMQREQDDRLSPLGVDGGGKEAKVVEKGEEDMPELYDDLIEAARTLPVTPEVPTLLGHTIECQALGKSDYEKLAQISDGSAKFHESAYDPWNIWRHLSFASRATTASVDDKEDAVAARTGETEDSKFEVTTEFFESCYNSSYFRESSHVVIMDQELETPIGMVSLVDNSPRNLSVRLDNLWITPAFQSRNIGSSSSSFEIKSLLSGPRRRVAKETLYVLMNWLFESCKYRRVQMEIDARHTVMRKFAEDCGFLHEGTLRKHRVMRKRSRDTAVYSMLNSDWKLGAKEALRLRSGIPKEKKAPSKDKNV